MRRFHVRSREHDQEKYFGRVVGFGQREGWLGKGKGDSFSSKFCHLEQ
jgi:hypothetical protein